MERCQGHLRGTWEVKCKEKGKLLESVPTPPRPVGFFRYAQFLLLERMVPVKIGYRRRQGLESNLT